MHFYRKSREDLSALRNELQNLRDDIQAHGNRLTKLESKHEHVYDPAREWKRDVIRTVIAGLLLTGIVGAFKLVMWIVTQMPPS